MADKILSMPALQQICRESKGTDGIRSAQLVRALIRAGLSESDATVTGANFFRDFDTLHRGVLSVKLFLDNYKRMTTLAVVKELLSDPGTSTQEVNLEQLTKVLSTKLDSTASARQAQQMFSVLDTDGSGTISTAELEQFRNQTEAAIQQAKDANTAAAVRETFDKFDCNGAADGKLDSKEFRMLCASLGEILSDDDHSALFGRIDQNGDGITYEQFSDWFLNPDRVSKSATGMNAALLRSRLMVSRGNNWLRTMAAKADAKRVSESSFNCGLAMGAPFDDLKAIFSLRLEEFHLDDDHKTWASESGIPGYASADIQTSQGEFIMDLLQPFLSLLETSRTTLDAKKAEAIPLIKLSRPNPDVLRITLGLPPKAQKGITRAPVDEMKSILQGAAVDIEFGNNAQSVADNFDNLTVADLLRARARVSGNLPPAELLQMAAPMAEEGMGVVGVSRIPGISDILEGKNGDLGTHNLQNLFTGLFNEAGGEILQEIKGSNKDTSNLPQFSIKTSDGKYLSPSGSFVGTASYVRLKEAARSDTSSFDSNSGSTDLPRYTLQHKKTGRYAFLNGDGKWVGSENKAYVRQGQKDGDASSDERNPTNGVFAHLRHVGTGRFAARGGTHWAIQDDPYAFFIAQHGDGKKSIRSTQAQEYMRHYSGDHDNFTQNYCDRDTFCNFEPAAGGFIIRNPTRDNARLAVHADGKLVFPNLSEQPEDHVWEMIEVPEPPPAPFTVPENHQLVTIRNRGNQQYAARNPSSHWYTTAAATRLFIETKDGKIHVRQVEEKQYMRHYSGDADNFKQSFPDRDTEWTLEGDDVGGYRFVNPTRSGGVLSVHGSGKLYVPNGSDGCNNDANSLWDITYGVPLEIEGAADEKKATAAVLGPATAVHFRSETVNKYMRHYNGDADNFTQDYMDSDTKWLVHPVVGSDNEVVVKHGSRDRWLSYNPAQSGDDRLFVPDSLPEDDKIWILIEAPEDAVDSGPDPNEDIYTQVWFESCF
jgi:Ca2+-binding EF-hand superfamily protein